MPIFDFVFIVILLASEFQTTKNKADYSLVSVNLPFTDKVHVLSET